MTIAAAVLIFGLTLTFVIWQPGRIGIGWSAAGGAFLALLLGVVDFSDLAAVSGMVWNATLTFVAVVLISLIMDEIGFFEWFALHMLRKAKGSGKRMFVSVILLGAAVSALFTNDGAALILGPIVLAKMRVLEFEKRMMLPFIMAGGFIADTASMPFTVSNLVNIVSADFYEIGFTEYMVHMMVPNLVSIAASIAVLYFVFHKQIPDQYDFDRLRVPVEAIKDQRLFRLSWIVLILLMAGYFVSEAVHMPVSIAAGASAMVLLAAARRSPALQVKKTFKEAPWAVIVFSIGMYVVVYGLENAGLTALLGGWINDLTHYGLFAASIGMGFLAAGLSAVMNNLPAVMTGVLAVQNTETGGVLREALIYANVIGADIGPKITPIGSLATLLWLHVLAGKGIQISWGYYFKIGVLLTVPTLFAVLCGLWAWLLVVG